ncbi:TonB-dependent hemoglobin/transferrin/lactoferrin family receptor, partial [Endozoicomonas sp.]|uniref:TonB-dependent hemoglobin/transferrin/lactoferrin family receptor n=1 Tax=Endozoicomonas sp. TaxID=1892382 RepID=UPI00383A8809
AEEVAEKEKEVRSKPTLMNQVTVTAARSEKQLKDVAGSVSVIGEEQIEAQLATNIKDLMRYEPGVIVGTNSRGGLDDFNIRGMEGNRVKVMVDGVDLPKQMDTGHYFQQPQRSQIDIEALKAVEIVKGPASSLYGSDAIGGIVAFQTKDPSDYLMAAGDDTAGSVKAGYSSVNEGFSETLTLANRTGDLESLMVYTRRDYKETETYGGEDIIGGARGEANPSDTASNNVLGKLQYQLNEDHRIGLTAEYFQDDIDAVFKTESEAGFEPVTGTDEVVRKRVGIFHQWQADARAFDQLRWQFDWQDSSSQQETFRPNKGDERKDYYYGEESLKLSAQFNKAFEYGSVSHQLVYGLDIGQSDVSNRNLVSKPGSVTEDKAYIPKVDDLAYGLFIQDDIQVNEHLLVTPGLRFDSYDYNPDGIMNDGSGDSAPGSNDSQLTGRIGAVYNLSSDLSAFAQFSQGFKAPDLFDMYYTDEKEVTIPYPQPTTGRYKNEANPNLKPEESNSIEFGLRGGNRLGSFEVAAFFSQYKNFIETVTYEDTYYNWGIFRAENIAKAEIKGIELKGQLWLDEAISAPAGTSLKVSLAYADGKGKQEGEGWQTLNSVAPLTGVIGLGYDDISGNWGGDLAWTLVKGKSDSDVEDGDFNPAGYGLMDMTAYYLPAKNVTLRAGLFNITDKKYHLWDDVRGLAADNPGLDRYSEPGRNFSISAKYDF